MMMSARHLTTIITSHLFSNEQSHVVGKIKALITILGIFKPSSCSIEIETIKEDWQPGGNFTVTVAGISVEGTWEELGLAIDSDTFGWRDLKFPYGVGDAENYPLMYDTGNINWLETWKITQLTVDPSLNCAFDYSEE